MRTKYWFDLIHQQVFRYVGTGLPGLTGTKLGLMRLAHRQLPTILVLLSSALVWPPSHVLRYPNRKQVVGI